MKTFTVFAVLTLSTYFPAQAEVNLNIYPLHDGLSFINDKGKAVKLDKLQTRIEDGAVQIRWNVKDEEEILNYYIQRSTDGTEFEVIGTVSPGSATGKYYFTDPAPDKGVNYYRLQVEEVNGNLTYSNIVSERITGASKIKICPNPFKRGLQVEFESATAGEERLLVYNESGEVVYNKTIELKTGINKVQLDLANLSRGTYNILLERSKATREFFKN